MNPILRKANLQGRFHHAGAWRVQRQVTPHGYKGLKGSGRKRGLKSGRTCGHDDGDLWDLFSETLSQCHQSPLDQITRMDTGHRATSPPPPPLSQSRRLHAIPTTETIPSLPHSLPCCITRTNDLVQMSLCQNWPSCYPDLPGHWYPYPQWSERGQGDRGSGGPGDSLARGMVKA